MTRFAALFACLSLLLSATTGVPMSVNDKISFCAVGEAWELAGKIEFDANAELAYMGAAEVSIVPIRKGNFVGFKFPFPLMVPQNALSDSTARVTWVASGYEFTAFPSPPRGPNWIVIHAKKIERNGGSSVRATSVLYSTDLGVVAFSRTAEYQGRSWTENHVLCSTRRMTVSDINRWYTRSQIKP